MADLSALLTGEALAERLFWQRSSPFVRTLGIVIENLDGDSVTMRVPWHPRLAIADGSDVIDPLVLPGLIDDCLSLAIGQVLPPPRGIATLDLWFAMLRAPVAGDVVAVARRLGQVGDVGTSMVEVYDAQGIVLHGGGTFILGHFPSGAVGDHAAAGRFNPKPLPGSFRSVLGLSGGASGVAMGASAAAIGWEAGPVYHGGAIAAALLKAAGDAAPPGQRVTSISIRYLRAAAFKPFAATARIDRAAQRASHLSVEGRVGDSVVATATALAA